MLDKPQQIPIPINGHVNLPAWAHALLDENEIHYRCWIVRVV